LRDIHFEKSLVSPDGKDAKEFIAIQEQREGTLHFEVKPKLLEIPEGNVSISLSLPFFINSLGYVCDRKVFEILQKSVKHVMDIRLPEYLLLAPEKPKYHQPGAYEITNNGVFFNIPCGFDEKKTIREALYTNKQLHKEIYDSNGNKKCEIQPMPEKKPDVSEIAAEDSSDSSKKEEAEPK
jgi:hypothetical protein